MKATEKEPKKRKAVRVNAPKTQPQKPAKPSVFLVGIQLLTLLRKLGFKESAKDLACRTLYSESRPDKKIYLWQDGDILVSGRTRKNPKNITLAVIKNWLK